jgi:hypothetical protein
MVVTPSSEPILKERLGRLHYSPHRERKERQEPGIVTRSNPETSIHHQIIGLYCDTHPRIIGSVCQHTPQIIGLYGASMTTHPSETWIISSHIIPKHKTGTPRQQLVYAWKSCMKKPTETPGQQTRPAACAYQMKNRLGGRLALPITACYAT